MPYRVVAAGTLHADGRTLYLRQGLEPLVVPNEKPFYVVTNRGASIPHVMQSPDKTKLILKGSSNTANEYFIYKDLSQLNVASASVNGLKSSFAFPNQIQFVAVSNTYYALTNTSTTLYVYRWSDLGLEAVNITGLGNIRRIGFSPDGTKLAVAHETSPFVRIYNTADWSFINASGTPRVGVFIGWSPDSTKVLIGGESTTASTIRMWYINATTGVSTTVSSPSSQHYFNGQARSIIDPLDPTDSIIFTSGTISTSTIYAKMNRYKFSTDTWTRSTGTGTNALQNRSLIHDPLNNLLLVVTDNTRYVSYYDTTTLELLETLSAERLANERSSLGSYLYDPNIDIGIVDTGGLYQITGTVRDINNAPAARDVYAYRRADNLLMAKTTSDAVTGDYVLKLPDEGPYDIQFRTATGESLNDLFYARAVPAQMT